MKRFSLVLLLLSLAIGCGPAAQATPTPTAMPKSTPAPSATPTTPPAEKETPTPKPTQKVHIVQPGDTLWRIAQSYGVDINVLIAANPDIKNPNLIQTGQKIVIPAP